MSVIVTITSPLNRCRLSCRWYPTPFGLLCVLMGNGFEDLDLDRLRRRRSEKWRRYPADVLPAFVAEMDYDLAEPVVAALRAAVDLDDCGYATPDGIGETFAAFAASRHGWTVDPGLVHLIPDVMAGVDALLALATEPGDGVVINTPVYPPFFQHIGFARRQVVEVPLARTDGGWELDFAGLEAAFAAGARGYLLCNPHNPTGRVFTEAEQRALAEVVDRHGVRVFADEIHAPLVYPGHRHVPYATVSADAARQAITAVSASKAWNLAGLKCAQLVFTRPDDLQRWREVGHFAGNSTSTLGVVAHTAAWRDGDAWLEPVLGYLQGNRDLLGRLLRQHLPQVGYIEAQGTYLAWLDCRALRLDGAPHLFFRRHARVALTDGAECGDGGEGHVRLNFAMPRPLLVEAVERMAAAVAAL